MKYINVVSLPLLFREELVLFANYLSVSHGMLCWDMQSVVYITVIYLFIYVLLINHVKELLWILVLLVVLDCSD